MAFTITSHARTLAHRQSHTVIHVLGPTIKWAKTQFGHTPHRRRVSYTILSRPERTKKIIFVKIHWIFPGDGMQCGQIDSQKIAIFFLYKFQSSAVTMGIEYMRAYFVFVVRQSERRCEFYLLIFSCCHLWPWPPGHIHIKSVKVNDFRPKYFISEIGRTEQWTSAYRIYRTIKNVRNLFLDSGEHYSLLDPPEWRCCKCIRPIKSTRHTYRRENKCSERKIQNERRE